MRLNLKFVRLAMLVALSLSLAGCGGVNLGGSVSPATFFLPGVMNAPAPKAGTPKMASKPVRPIRQFAQAR